MLDRYVYNATVYLYTTRQMPPMLDHHKLFDHRSVAQRLTFTSALRLKTMQCEQPIWYLR